MYVPEPWPYANEWQAICSIAEKFGAPAETVRKWVRQARPVETTGLRVSEDQVVCRGIRRALRPAVEFARQEIGHRAPRRDSPAKTCRRDRTGTEVVMQFQLPAPAALVGP